MVLGVCIAVIAVPGRYQCADTANIADGRGIAAPNWLHASVYWLCASVFIGLPCPRNSADMRD